MAQYKTICLELLQDQPELYERLRSSKRLLPTLDAHATELKASHDRWKQRIALAKPGSDPAQAAAEAMELAIEGLRHRLASASAESDGGMPSPAAATASSRPATPNA